MLHKHIVHKLIRSAFKEDIGIGDITTTAILTGEETGTATALAKSKLVIAGINIFREAFLYIDKQVEFNSSSIDGQVAEKGTVLAEVSGRLQSIITAERVALNLLQRMCGIATLTRQFVDQIKGTSAKILDTRKTIPGLRYFDKLAVRIGGGFNHRFGLYDGVLIKDNHISAAGGIFQAMSRVRGRIPHTLKVEVEVKNIHELEEALSAGADVIMLDNMTLEDMRKSVSLVNGKVPLEASGNVTLANVKQIAETGIDFISVGMLTHSVPAADISLIVK
jgi:nicotinate-nucleotide pyrophosphorylase (carboxylating)